MFTKYLCYKVRLLSLLPLLFNLSTTKPSKKKRDEKCRMSASGIVNPEHRRWWGKILVILRCGAVASALETITKTLAFFHSSVVLFLLSLQQQLCPSLIRGEVGFFVKFHDFFTHFSEFLGILVLFILQTESKKT